MEFWGQSLKRKMKNLEILEKTLGIKFKNPKLLAQALVHRSYLNEVTGRGIRSNERLELLGDSVLSFIISEWLFKKFPTYPEGELTNLRSNIVRTSSLAQIAQKLKLGNYLLLSRGEQESGGAQNPSILADTLEAVIGAIYLDQGIEVIQNFVKEKFTPLIEEITKRGELKDAKSILQEKLQEEIKETPVYKTLKEEGPDHDKIFTVGVYIQGKLLAKGKGKSKQMAEEEAAKVALKGRKNG